MNKDFIRNLDHNSNTNLAAKNNKMMKMDLLRIAYIVTLKYNNNYNDNTIESSDNDNKAYLLLLF